jgi:hypothetical protein
VRKETLTARFTSGRLLLVLLRDPIWFCAAKSSRKEALNMSEKVLKRQMVHSAPPGGDQG